MMTDNKQSDPFTLAITMGDPAGIGPEVVRRYVNQHGPDERCSIVIAGDEQLLLEDITQRAKDRHRIRCTDAIPVEPPEGGEVFIWNASDVHLASSDRGRPSPEAGRAALDYIRAGYQLVEEGIVDGIVTGPVSKKSISRPDRPFTGHTEWFAERQEGSQPVMGITCDDWIATTVTRHIPVRDVPSALTGHRIASTIEVLHEDVKRYFGLNDPRIGVTGLNPHAGEGGKIGSEEIEVIEPVIDQLREEGIQVEGPSSAETLLTEAGFERFDAVVVMFHDQAFVPLKSRGLDRCASVTFGLNMVRTSVAHGTGYDLVGSDDVSEQSLCNAVELAQTMVRRQTTYQMSSQTHGE